MHKVHPQAIAAAFRVARSRIDAEAAIVMRPFRESSSEVCEAWGAMEDFSGGNARHDF